MNFCPFCGKELNEGIQFCPFCGKVLVSDQVNDTSAVQPNHTQAQQAPSAPSKENARSPKKFVIGLLALVIIIALAAIAIIAPFGSDFTEDPDAIQKASESVVKLYMYDANGVSVATGSGFAAFDKDIIVTNHHCIEGDVYSIKAQREDGSTFAIDSVIAYNEEKDIAVLRAPNCGLTPLKTTNGHNIKQGEKVAAIGSPEGIASMYSTGVISKIEDRGTYSVLLSTASISHGSSGGAMFNNRGEVIAITSAGHVSGNDIYMSVPIEYAQELYDKRTPETELTLAEFYEQSDHPYLVDYLISHGSKLNKQTVTVHGYISGLDSGIFLVSSPSLVLHIDVRKTFDLVKLTQLTDQRSKGQSIQVDIKRNNLSSDDFKTGEQIEIVGTVMFYSSSDIRLNATSIKKIN